MKKLTIYTLCAGAAAILLGAPNVNAQPGPQSGGGFDPAQMRQRMMDRYREVLDVKSDDEWKILQTRIEKVTTARRALGGGGFGMMGGFRGGPGGPGGQGGPGGPPGQGGPPPGGAGGPGGFGPPSNPEMEALQQALDDNASNDQIKAKLTALRESRKTKQAALEKAQDELKQLLSAKQEAAAVLAGLLQ
jgi:hypothetical protein